MSSLKETDFLIIGQGIAGTHLCHALMKRHQKVEIFDLYHPATSSRVAAGLFHPLTGRRYAKSWMIEKLYAFATALYRDQEELLGEKFFFPTELIEILSSVHDFNVLSERLGDNTVNQYLTLSPSGNDYDPCLQKYFKMVAFKGSGWMNIEFYLELSRMHFIRHKLYESGNSETTNLKHSGDGIIYGNYYTKNIIFCEGSDSARNLLWNWLPFQLSKGEIITIEAPQLPEQYILLKGLFLIPLGNHRFRVGSTYTWDYNDALPSDEGLNTLMEKLGKIISVPYTVIDHRSAVRPTTKDRRPFIGSHPVLKNTYIFNGFGTKGVLLTPYFAHEFCDHLLKGSEINPEADIRRFYSFFSRA